MMGADAKYCRIHTGDRAERAARDVEEPFGVGNALHADRESAILALAGGGRHPDGDLLLYHYHECSRPVCALQQLEEQRRRDVVRDVADDLEIVRELERAEVDLERVGVHELEAGMRPKLISKLVGQPIVELDGNDTLRGCDEVVCECALSGTNLNHDIVRLRFDRRDDLALNVWINEEVLAEGFLGTDSLTHPRINTAERSSAGMSVAAASARLKIRSRIASSSSFRCSATSATRLSS